jgi:uncharacterized protein (DUF362 family)
VRGNNARSSNLTEGLDHLERMCSARGMSRRDFLKISGIAVVGLALPMGCNAPPEENNILNSGVIDLARPPAPAGDITVGIVRKSDIGAAVNRAIELAGGLDEIRNGDSVVIKPNLTTGYTLSTRVTTHPEVLRAVIRAVKARTDAANITVAEASAYTDPSTLEVARKVGVYDVVSSEGVNFLAWEDEEYVEAGSYYFKQVNFHIMIPKSLGDSRFKHFINVPMLKNHEAVENSNADYTCCIKNHVGVISRETRIRGGGNGIHQTSLGEKVAELNLVVPQHTMNVVDALTVILSGGPAALEMQYTDPGLILAGKDRVACDSLGLAVLRHYASQLGISKPYLDKSIWRQAQIVRAQELNLGRDQGNIRISSEGVAEIDGIMSKWN